MWLKATAVCSADVVAVDVAADAAAAATAASAAAAAAVVAAEIDDDAADALRLFEIGKRLVSD